jgi:hypothetical protein
MSEIWDLKTTDGDNTAAGFGFPENMNPSDVNDNLRAILGSLARWYGDTNGTLVSAGTGGAYTIASPNRSWTTSYSDGAVLMFQAHTVCSSAPTLAVDGKTAKVIMKNATTTVSASDIIQDQICLVAYESTLDKWQMLSPVSGSGTAVGDMLGANNLSDVDTAATALSNIGGIGAATTDTLTNKTIDADGTGNVITNIGSSEIKSEMITGQTEVTIAAGDAILLSDADDSGNLKRDTVQGILDLVSAGFTLGTEVATTSGTAADFTSIPSGTKQIIINFVGVSWSSANSSPTIVLGDAGGFETSGYVGAGAQSFNATSSSRTDSFALADTNRVAAADTLHGSVILTLEDATNFVWSCQGMVGVAGASDYVMFTTGSKALSAELTQVRVTTVAGDTFDAGAINVQYIG